MSDFLRQFRWLAYSDKLKLCGIIISIIILKISLRIIGFKRIVEFLRKTSYKKDRQSRKPFEYYRGLMQLSYMFFARDGFCLSTSLVFWRLLQKEGINTQLFFGTKKQNGKLFAHAWLEYEGIPLGNDRNVSKKYKKIEISIASF